MSARWVAGDPEGLREAAARLRALAAGFEDDRDQARQQAHAVTGGGAWDGKAAARFTSTVAARARDFDPVAATCRDSAWALDDYAAELERARSRAAALEQQAAGSGLWIDADGVVRPQPVGQAAGAPPRALPPEAGELQAAARQILEQAGAAAAECRRRLDAARQQLPKEFWKEFSWAPPLDPGSVLGYAHTILTAGPNSLDALNERYERKRHRLYRQAKRTGDARYYEWWKQRMRIQKAWARRVGGNNQVLRQLNTSVRQLAGDAKWLRWAKNSTFSKVPAFGGVFTAMTIAGEINEGRSPTAAIVTNGGSLVVGSLAGAAAAGTGVGLFVGAPIVLGVGTGLAVGYGVGKAGEWFFEHTSVGRGIARTVDNTVGRAASAVSDAAGAVGGAIAEGWRSVFG